jgi:catechol 2,3-dioxygenase-like lactoylglutathione lyase family enzyme
MPAPRLRGLHHLKLPVADLDRSLAWYQRVFEAEHLSRFDHFGDDGVRYAVMLALPGVDVPVELRWAPVAAAVTTGYDPINFAVGGLDDLRAWLCHLDALQVDHSPIISASAGHLVVFRSPDGLYLRLLTLPDGGVQDIEMDRAIPQPRGAWLAPKIMQPPGTP